MTVTIEVASHPLLDLTAFTACFPRPLGEIDVPDWLRALLATGADAGAGADPPPPPPPTPPDDALRRAVRDLLRHGGYKPTGRGKPASEYLARAAEEGRLQSINAAADAGNAASLRGGLPISVVDLDRLQPPLSVAPAAAGSTYAFNPAGQVIDVGGLPCLHDRNGPRANAVRDAQDTKTGGSTTRTLALTWSTRAAAGRARLVTDFHRGLLLRLGASTEDVALILGA